MSAVSGSAQCVDRGDPIGRTNPGISHGRDSAGSTWVRLSMVPSHGASVAGRGNPITDDRRGPALLPVIADHVGPTDRGGVRGVTRLVFMRGLCDVGIRSLICSTDAVNPKCALLQTNPRPQAFPAEHRTAVTRGQDRTPHAGSRADWSAARIVRAEPVGPAIPSWGRIIESRR